MAAFRSNSRLHDKIIVVAYAVAVVLMAVADSLMFLWTGTLTLMATCWTLGCVVGLIYYARKI